MFYLLFRQTSQNQEMEPEGWKKETIGLEQGKLERIKCILEKTSCCKTFCCRFFTADIPASQAKPAEMILR
ncbi:MAG: hypothetical protein P0107_06770 [Nitrosomonas sp.]|nr:hypothetical protein [Nitrosomonas sp.]